MLESHIYNTIVASMGKTPTSVQWAGQKKHLDMNTHGAFSGTKTIPTIRAGLIVKQKDGSYARAFRRNGSEKEGLLMRSRMAPGAFNRLVYVPKWFEGKGKGKIKKPKARVTKRR